MKAIGYIRVSSDSQADNFSPQVQEELIKVQFQSMIEEGDIPNYVSLEMITDISVSGSLEFAERPAGRNLLSLDEGDYLFLSDTNRLSRQTRISDPFQIECIEKGINIIVYNMGNITQDISYVDLLMNRVKTGVDEYFARDLKDKCRRGKRKKRGSTYHSSEKEKGFLGGSAAWGYQVVGEKKQSKIVKHKWRDEVLNYIQTEYKSGKTYRSISESVKDKFKHYGPEVNLSYVTVRKLIMSEEQIENFENNLPINNKVVL
tara:strand:- start:228 stop:1007 length:780 start_codon:yes stop_codon:yes gene_type:complete